MNVKDGRATIVCDTIVCDTILAPQTKVGGVLRRNRRFEFAICKFHASRILSSQSVTIQLKIFSGLVSLEFGA